VVKGEGVGLHIGRTEVGGDGFLVALTGIAAARKQGEILSANGAEADVAICGKAIAGAGDGAGIGDRSSVGHENADVIEGGILIDGVAALDDELAVDGGIPGEAEAGLEPFPVCLLYTSRCV